VNTKQIVKIMLAGGILTGIPARAAKEINNYFV
jgi:hypothetical protein